MLRRQTWLCLMNEPTDGDGTSSVAVFGRGVLFHTSMLCVALVSRWMEGCEVLVGRELEDEKTGRWNLFSDV